MKQLLLGNESVARGLWEAGVRFVDVRLFPAQTDNLIRHLCRINPDIKVQDKHYT